MNDEFTFPVDTRIIPAVNCTQCHALTPRDLNRSLTSIEPHRRFFFCEFCWAHIPLAALRSTCLAKLRDLVKGGSAHV